MGQEPPPLSSPCDRNVEADLLTASARLEKQRPQEALAYLLPLSSCPESLENPRWWSLRASAHEAMGDLHPAWLSLQRALSIHQSRGQSEAVQDLQRRCSSFLSRYVRLVSPPGNPKLFVRYAGPVPDASTLRQLDEVALGRFIPLGQDRYGYLVLPGTYDIGTGRCQLLAGQALSLEEGCRE